MQKINYRSDFDFILHLYDCSGKELPFPAYDFKAILTTEGGGGQFIASQTGGVQTNCFNDNGKLHIVCNDHKLPPGKLRVSFEGNVPDTVFVDGHRFNVTAEHLPIALVMGKADVCSAVDLQLILPTIKGDPFLYGDFTPEQIQTLQRPALEAAMDVQQKINDYNAAEQARIENEDRRIRFEQQRIEAENLRKKDATARQEQFAQAQTERTTVFNASEAKRTETFNASEQARTTAFGNSEAQRQQAFNAAEQTRNTGEQQRNAAEEVRQRNDQTRANDYNQWKAGANGVLSGLTNTENSVQEAERMRVNNERQRVDNEEARKTNETARVNAETLRTRDFQTAQTNRENAFNAAQDARTKAFGTAQNDRATQFDQAQTARVTAFNDAEKGRQTLFTNKEAARQSAFDKAETARATAETARAKAETARADAETKRETDFGNAKAAAETATAGAVKAEKEATAAAGEARRFVNDLLPCVEENCYYGIEWDTEVATSECTRIGSMKLHRTLPVQSNMKGCLLAEDGTVVQYLSADDWKNPAMVDGSKGQVMIEVRSYWWKFESEGTKRRCLLSSLPMPGFVLVPTTYIGAYEAAMNRTTGQLCSVANMATVYRGGNNNAAYDGTYRDLCGRPASHINRINFRAAARKGRDNRWAAGMYYIQTMLYWLFAVEYATLNSQTPMTAELTPEGFKQGGLGTGATNLTSDEWNKFNGYYPFIPCGYTNSLGDGTGEMMYPLVGADGATIKEVPCVRYRGVENPFGHTWMWADGINLDMDASVANGGTGITKVYVTDDHSLLNDYGFDGYTYVGDTPQYDWGFWIRDFIFGETGCIMPTMKLGGNSAIHCADYIYMPNNPSARSLRGVLCGGSSTHGATAGLACSGTICVPATSDSTVASRLCFRA